MADDYISKQRAKDLMGCCLASTKANYKAAKDEFTKARLGDYISAIQSMIDVVGAVEAADVQPVVLGQWLDRLSTKDSKKCSICGNSSIQPDRYCGYCGARMDGGEQNGR